MRTLVALEAITCDNLDSVIAQEIVQATMEEGVVDLVTSALAIITASWEQAGGDLGIGDETGTDPDVHEWCSHILERAMVLAKLKWFALRADYAINVGPLPSLKGTKP